MPADSVRAPQPAPSDSVSISAEALELLQRERDEELRAASTDASVAPIASAEVAAG